MGGIRSFNLYVVLWTGKEYMSSIYWQGLIARLPGLESIRIDMRNGILDGLNTIGENQVTVSELGEGFLDLSLGRQRRFWQEFRVGVRVVWESHYILNKSGYILGEIGVIPAARERKKFLGLFGYWSYVPPVEIPGELVGAALLRLGLPGPHAAYLVTAKRQTGFDPCIAIKKFPPGITLQSLRAWEMNREALRRLESEKEQEREIARQDLVKSRLERTLEQLA